MNPVVYNLLRDHPRTKNRLIGLELERLAVNQEGKLIHYNPEIKSALDELVSQKNWKVIYEWKGNKLALKKALNGISLEPGAQFEFNVAPQKNVQAVKEESEKLIEEVAQLSSAKNWRFYEIGLNPFERPEDITLLPSKRYQFMDSYFKETGRRGREMMRLTAGLQVNLDYFSEEEGAEMLKCGFYLAPILNTLFANSPYFHGKKTGTKSERQLIWQETDPLRSQFLDFVLNESFSLKDYAEYVSRTPLMYAFDSNENVIDPKGRSLNDLPDELVQINAVPAMRQIFTEVRLKPCCIELRCFDAVPDEFRHAATAMSVGLLYDEENRKKILNKFNKLSVQDLKTWMFEGAQKGLEVSQIRLLAQQILEWSREGLKRRALDEEKFLKPAEDLVEKAQTPADLLLEKWKEKPEL